MEPVTHLLTGACLARTGFDRRVRYATVGMALAAEFPDVDTVWSLEGPVSGFQHHRGITHTLLGLPFEAAFLLLCVFGWHTLRGRGDRASAGSSARSRTALRAPFRWGALYGCLLLALLSHLLLDYTNNYGIRPFFPFNSRWYAASIVFIVDPVILLLLLGGLLLPALFGLIGQEIEGKRTRFPGAGWARTALVAILAVWTLRVYEHSRALALAETQTVRAPADLTAADEASVPEQATENAAAPPTGRPVLLARRSLASPDPFNPFRWYTATDFGSFYLLGTADTGRGVFASGPTLDKPAASRALSVAEATRMGRVYLDWSPMPWITLSVADSVQRSRGADSPTTVTFEDVRFMGSTGLLRGDGPPPLSGFVVVDRHGAVAEGMDGRIQP